MLEQKMSLVEQYQNSGLSRNSFCLQNGISLSTFSYWVKKYKAQQQPLSSEFIRLETSPRSTSKIEIVFPNQVRIFCSEWSTDQISRLVKLY